VSVQEGTLLVFVIAVCRRISPSSFQRKRPIGAASVRRSPEAQYCDEFYRASSAHTEGTAITFSESGVELTSLFLRRNGEALIMIVLSLMLMLSGWTMV
jgi:hypothetical protein